MSTVTEKPKGELFEQRSLRMPVAGNPIARRIVEGRETLASFVPPGLNARQFLASVIQQANSLSVSLRKEQVEDPRTIASFCRSAFNCAVIGLIPGEALGHAYFIPYTLNRGQNGEYVSVQLIPGYRGFLELAYGNGYLLQCDPEVVLDGEECEVWHDTAGPQIKHLIPLRRGEVKPERVIATYCTYTPRGGKSTLGALVEGHVLRDIARGAGKRSPWNTGSYVAMSMKTSIRMTAKRWRVTREMASAIDLDERAERGESQHALYEEERGQERELDPNDIPDEDLVEPDAV
jgi:recombination protein RecT